MNYRDLRAYSAQNYRKNGFISHILFFFIMLLGCAFLLLGLLLADLLIIVVPFIFMPCFFAVQIAIILLRDQEYITFTGFLRCFGNYYSEKFNSTFRVIKAVLWSLLISVIFYFIYSISLNIGLYYTNYIGYRDIMNEIVDNFNFSIDELNRLLTIHKDFFDIVMILMNVPSYFVFAICFMFITTRYSISLFNRLDTMEFLGRVNKILQERIIKRYRKEFDKAYWYVQWPIYLLFTCGFVLGAYFGYIYLGTYYGVFTLGLATGIFVTFGLYGPFYLAGNEAIYNIFKDKYKIEFESMKGEMAMTLNELIEKMNEENKKDSDES